MSFKKCRICKEKFEVEREKQPVCSNPDCAIEWLKQQQEKDARKKEKAFRAETRRLKESIKSKGKWTQEAQAVFNKWVRLSQADQPCISCGRSTGCKVNAGHYLSVGAHPHLRFNEYNVHLQCEHCNCFLSGNQVEYRKRLIDKIGIDKVEWLEGPHPIVRLTIDDIKEIKAKYTELAKGIERDQQSTFRI